jgi:hypothetical protein
VKRLTTGMDGRWTEVRVPGRGAHIVKIVSGYHLFNEYLGIFSLGVKRPGCDADHSSPTSDEVKNTWIYASIPLYVFMIQCLLAIAATTGSTKLTKQRDGKNKVKLSL